MSGGRNTPPPSLVSAAIVPQKRFRTNRSNATIIITYIGCTLVRCFCSENVIYVYMSAWNRLYWSRVTDLCIAYQSTVPFVANCCSGIIKHNRARILIEWLYRNIFMYVDGSVYENVIFIAVVIFFATFNAHSCLLQAYYILWFEIRNLLLFKASTTARLTHTHIYIHGDFHEFPAH